MEIPADWVDLKGHFHISREVEFEGKVFYYHGYTPGMTTLIYRLEPSEPETFINI